MAKQRKTWVFTPPKPPPPPVPADLKAEVEEKAGALVEEFLKPKFIKPPPEDQGLTLDKCLKTIREDPTFQP